MKYKKTKIFTAELSQKDSYEVEINKFLKDLGNSEFPVDSIKHEVKGSNYYCFINYTVIETKRY